MSSQSKLLRSLAHYRIASATLRVITILLDVRLLVITSFLGAYTTFFTYGLESVVLFRPVLGNSFALHSFIVTSLYWAGSAILGIISLQLGVILARLGRA